MPGEILAGSGVSAHYGSLGDAVDAEAAKLVTSKRRRRVNCVPLLLAWLLPWFVFVFCFATAAFFVHYAAPLSSTLCELLVVAVCLGRVPWAYKSWKRGGAKEGFYPVYITAGVILAAVVGWAMGDFTFWAHMEPSYMAVSMASYTEVDPSSTRLANGQVVPTDGGRFQDAGQVYFNHDTVLDVNRSFSFKLADLYCVAPIRNKQCSEPCGSDFWAIGKNCCSEDGSNFKCGDAGSKRAKSGLRLVEAAELPFYRLAVIQATGKYKMVSPHPIFFKWLEDPVAELHAWQRQGFRLFVIAMSGAFVFSGAALALAVHAMHIVI